MRNFYLFRLSAEMWRISSQLDFSLIAAGIAFFIMLSIFPGLATLVALFGLAADRTEVLGQFELMQDFIPAPAYAILHDQLASLLAVPADNLSLASLLSFILALWSARTGVASLIRGLNAVFERPNRHGVWHVLVSLLMTLALICVALIAMIVVVVLPVVIAILPDQIPSGPLIEISRWIIAFAVLIGALALLYRFAPNQTWQRVHWVSPGAGIVVLLWLFASNAFSIYLANFGHYNEVYGSIGAVIALLMWLYISAYLILFGAALNVAIENLNSPQSSEVSE